MSIKFNDCLSIIHKLDEEYEQRTVDKPAQAVH